MQKYVETFTVKFSRTEWHCVFSFFFFFFFFFFVFWSFFIFVCLNFMIFWQNGTPNIKPSCLLVCWWCESTIFIFIPRQKKVAGYYVLPSEPFVSVRPSVSASFPDLNLCSYLPIFFKLCMDIDIGECFVIANGLNSFINNRVMALHWCKMCFSSISLNKWLNFDNILYIHWYIQDPRCIKCMYFWSIFNRIMALDWRQNFVYAQYLVN